jgi:hypothetical protein
MARRRKEMGELDQDACMEIITDLVREEGDAVYVQTWDSGGLGAGSDFVYAFRGWYWWDDDFGLAGPFESLIEAFPEQGIAVTQTTVRIRSVEWDTDTIIENIRPQDLEGKQTININGEEFDVYPDGSVMLIE